MRSSKGVIQTPFFLFLALSLGACASTNGLRQPVLVTSKPSGLSVYDRGQLVGVTPGFMRIRRTKDPVLELRGEGKAPQTLRLTRKYRWYDSFWGNALFLNLAPVGWVTDFLTGSAWEMGSPPLEDTTIPAKGSRLAIAPPDSSDREVADAVGPLIEQKLREEGQFNVRQYQKTLPHFDYYNTSSTLPIDSEERYGLLADIESDAIFLSSVTENKEGVRVQGEIKNIYSGEVIAKKSWSMPPVEGGAPLRTQVPRYFHFLPNTIFLSSTNFSASLTIDEVPYSGRAVSDGSTLESISTVVGAIGITRLQRPRANTIGRWTVDFVPSFNFSSRRIRYQFFTPPQDQDFDRIYASAGYGIEAGYIWKYGFPYVDVIPTLTWTQLKYDVSGTQKVMTSWSSTFVGEAGYQYFFSDHFVGKIFVRSLGEDKTLWKKAVVDILARDVKLETANSVVGGIALGYYFPSGAKRKVN